MRYFGPSELFSSASARLPERILNLLLLDIYIDDVEIAEIEDEPNEIIARPFTSGYTESSEVISMSIPEMERIEDERDGMV
jgi:hypothetical protein